MQICILYPYQPSEMIRFDDALPDAICCIAGNAVSHWFYKVVLNEPCPGSGSREEDRRRALNLREMYNAEWVRYGWGFTMLHPADLHSASISTQ